MHEQVQQKVHKRLLALRCIERTLATESFEEAYEKATEGEKIELNLLIAGFKDKEVKAWLGKINKGRLQFMSHRALAALGKEYNIYLWSRLSKDELVEKLRDALSVSECERLVQPDAGETA